MRTEYWKVMARNSADDPFWGTSDKIPTKELADDLYIEFVDRFNDIKMIHCIIEEEIVKSKINGISNDQT